MPNAGPVDLDQLAAGKLPPRILELIAETELTLGEMTDWAARRPRVRVYSRSGSLHFELRGRIPIKKALLALLGLVGALWALVEFVAQNPALIKALASAIAAQP